MNTGILKAVLRNLFLFDLFGYRPTAAELGTEYSMHLYSVAAPTTYLHITLHVTLYLHTSVIIYDPVHVTYPYNYNTTKFRMSYLRRPLLKKTLYKNHPHLKHHLI